MPDQIQCAFRSHIEMYIRFVWGKRMSHRKAAHILGSEQQHIYHLHNMSVFPYVSWYFHAEPPCVVFLSFGQFGFPVFPSVS